MDDVVGSDVYGSRCGSSDCYFRRGKPGQIVVDHRGNRFANEAQPYNDFVKAMFESLVVNDEMTSCFMVFDQNFRDRYPLATMMPGITPEKHLKSGFVRRRIR